MNSPRFWPVAPLLATSLLFLAGCASAPATHLQSPPGITPHVVVPQTHTPQHPLDAYVPGVDNFGFISADIWRGARPTPQGIDTLANMGVKTVINLEQHYNDLPPAGIHYIHLPTSPFHCDHLDIHALLQAIHDNPKPIFIHCQAGKDRTGLAVAAYRLSQGMSPTQAIEELRNFHVHALWRPFIEHRIAQLQKHREDGNTPSSRPTEIGSLPAPTPSRASLQTRASEASH
jgi:protein tyrosine phosphatase (PTP) superfamily phosphohydrolase (DUF442 family)